MNKCVSVCNFFPFKLLVSNLQSWIFFPNFLQKNQVKGKYASLRNNGLYTGIHIHVTFAYLTKKEASSKRKK